MFDETEQGEMDDFTIGFDDAEEITEIQEQWEQQSEPVYTARYDGREQELSVPQPRANALNGMDYDRTRQELEALRTDDAFTLVDELAREMGVSRREYVSFIRQSREQEEINAEVQRGIPEDVARELHQYRKKEQSLARQQEAEEARKAGMADYTRLAKEFPNLKEFPSEVIEAIAAGESPYAAYIGYDNARLRQRVQAAEQGVSNRQHTIGSVADSMAARPSDDFMEGWNSI